MIGKKGCDNVAELANCTNCDKVFAKRIREICDACFKREEEDFKIVYCFLKESENREATLRQIAQETKVSESIIIKFMKNKRLRISQFPKLAYPCERCSTDIVTGTLCEECATTLLENLETPRKEDVKKTESGKSNVYYTFRYRKT